ncbi:MAG: LacI family DNA-binding transcriptional regulator, partial [Pseudomonadota bacterium]
MAERKGRARTTIQSSPTLDDVARLAGVSTATVSRCLNSPQQVVEDTRERVLAVVREIGYAPNFGARALAAKRTNTIGAIIPTMENAIFARGLQAFQEELGQHGFTLLVASSSYRPDYEEEQIRTLLARGADALLLIGFHRPSSAYAFLERRGVPFVVSWAYRQDAQVRSVGFDNRIAMRALARRVVEFGHKRIAIVTAPCDVNDRARER